MKKLVTIIAMVGAAYGAFAQGTVLFDNNSTGEVDVYNTNNVMIGSAKAVGDTGSNPGSAVWHVALLFSATAGGGIAQANLTELVDYIPNVNNNAFDGVGSFEYVLTAGGKEAPVTTPTGSGSGTFEVVSWLGTATTWAAALAGGATYETQGANLVEFTAAMANPSTTPPGIPGSINTTGQWNGSAILTPVVAVPEPTTIALGGLGAAALLLFRRRK